MEHAQRKGLFDPLPLPDARATEDIDAFLSLDIFALPMRASFRGALTRLGYTPRTHYYQFQKSTASNPSFTVLLDLLAPLDVRDGIKTKPPRIGPVDNQDSPPEQRLHAHVTPEAFAIEHGCQELALVGQTPDGHEFNGVVHIPHPFASLCMKIKAAHDHERTPIEQRLPRKRGEKHAPDVYLLMAMLNETEFDQVAAYVQRFRAHPQFIEIQQAARALFETPNHPGCRTIENNIRDALDLGKFCAAMGELFGPGAIT
jgi:hypothetical protein